MPVTVQHAYGSFVYESNAVSIERWDDEPGYAAVAVPVPRSDRGRDADGFLRPRQVRLSGIIGEMAWTSQDDLRAAVDAFRAAHRPGRRNLYRDSDRYLRNAQVERLRTADEGLLWQRIDVDFIAADPFWYSTTPDSDSWSTPADTGTRTLANGGSVTALPVFTVELGSSGTLGLTLANTTTGQGFEIAGLDVTSGDELVIDCDAGTVKLEGVNKMSAFEGKFWALDPGNNGLELSLSGVTLASIATAWVKRWL